MANIGILEVVLTNGAVLTRLGDAAHAMLDKLYVDEETETTEVREFYAALKDVAESVRIVKDAETA